MLDNKLSITASTLTNALGHGKLATMTALRNEKSGLRQCDFDDAPLNTWIGRVDGVEYVTLPDKFKRYDCRNNRLAILALEQDDFIGHINRVIYQYGSRRIGLFMGTSTSGIHEAELAYRHRNKKTGKLPAEFDLQATHLIYSSIELIRNMLGINGPSLAISTACSSSAKVFAAAHRHMASDLCDAAIVGGVDSLCLSTLYGFNALQLISDLPCRPWDADRNGINIGEAAGFALLERNRRDTGNIALLGYGESSDAYHIATPHPEGKGAAIAMNNAIRMAKLTSSEIDYINLHGTATPSNDTSENLALYSIFNIIPPFSSTKGWTGHTLGAAGITEAVIACQSLENNFIPGTLNTTNPDNTLSDSIVLESYSHSISTVLSNSFGFGGSNCSLVFGEISK